MGVGDLRRAMAFWMDALGYVPREGETDDDWTVLVPAEGTGSALALMLSASPPEDRPRMHLDLYAGDAADQAAEVERLIALGAARVGVGPLPRRRRFHRALRHGGQPVLCHRHEHGLTSPGAGLGPQGPPAAEGP